MKPRILKIITLSFLSATIPLSHALAAPTASLDGQTFIGEIIPKGDSKGDPDNFEFKNGKFHSTSCDEYGYKEGSYHATAGKGVTTFKAETTNDKGAKMAWNGIIKGDKLTGTAVMSPKSGEKTNFTFSGTLQK